MRISDWSSDVCSSDLQRALPSVMRAREACEARTENARGTARPVPGRPRLDSTVPGFARACLVPGTGLDQYRCRCCPGRGLAGGRGGRSEEHTSELQSLMRISYAVFCLKKTKKTK